jgi:hypothetical protein
MVHSSISRGLRQIVNCMHLRVEPVKKRDHIDQIADGEEGARGVCGGESSETATEIKDSKAP